MDFKKALGMVPGQRPRDSAGDRARMVRYIHLQLIALGLPTAMPKKDAAFADVAQGLLDRYREKNRLLADHRSPADQRIEQYLADHVADLQLDEPLRLPHPTLLLDRHGMARELSLPADADDYANEFVSSYRVKNGVLHNPVHDRRTTQGTFHIAEGGLPIPADKKSVPKLTFARLFQAAVNPPPELLELPFTSNQPRAARIFASLMLRPLVCPAVPSYCEEQTMETRFFVPGSLVSNLDFVESIFGNAGDPTIPDNDAALDVDHWTGHTGAVILAPHLVKLTKREVGLPHYDDATEQQRKQGMCWRNEDERYNDGQAFKLACRTEAGVMVTLIADNYFGYCKKEVKTQISYAANLLGGCEEEHAGGAIAFASYNLGEEFQVNSQRYNGRTFQDVERDYGHLMDVHPDGYGVDKNYTDLIYIPEDARASVREQNIAWTRNGRQCEIPLLPGKVFMTPSGYKLRMEKHPEAPTWRLIGTIGEGVVCHKPCTVSGGGKSEISKPIQDYMLYGPVFVADAEHDLEQVQQICDRDYADRWRPDAPRRWEYTPERPSRTLLDPRRSLGSVIKLLTPSPHYTDEYNAWLESIPNYVLALVYIIKRFQGTNPNWDQLWRNHFGVDIVNGFSGHELKYHGRKLVGTYLRVGLLGTAAWRTFKVRQDFASAEKLQTEDDITASVVVPGRHLHHLSDVPECPSYKLVRNCEYRLFQRPDDAIVRGLDKQTEADLASPGNFISNFEPLTAEQLKKMTKYVVDFDAFSKPMQKFLRAAKASESSYVVCSSNPRQIDGKPTKNPRYLQIRPDLVHPMHRYVAEMGARFFRAVPAHQAVPFSVHSVLVGRRNNPPDKVAGFRSLAVYSPIHYQELPELFMDFIASLTGKSPSTTGAGSEGALTKGPFNALRPAADLNAALVSFILTRLAGFSTAAGFIGPKLRVDHDISLLIPEVWCRTLPEEREPDYLIAEKMLEKIDDFEHNGETILASRLGYRITSHFVRRFFGRVFDHPNKVFDEEILKPELQDLESFADGVKHITETQQRVAQRYLGDGSYEDCAPPIQAVLSIMAEGEYQGKDVHAPEVRQMFTLDYLLESDWYQQRLRCKQQQDVGLWQRHIAYLDDFLARPHYASEAQRLGIPERKRLALQRLERVQSAAYLKDLVGTLGVDPSLAGARRQTAESTVMAAGG